LNSHIVASTVPARHLHQAITRFADRPLKFAGNIRVRNLAPQSVGAQKVDVAIVNRVPSEVRAQLQRPAECSCKNASSGVICGLCRSYQTKAEKLCRFRVIGSELGQDSST